MPTPLAAIDPARSASVAASAGTGKTWLLAARIVRLLLAGAAPERILALTFTRKAAAEMSQRVREALRELAFAAPATLDARLAAIGVTADDAVRARARRLFEDLLLDPIGLRATTLHAFCQDIVSRFPLQCGVPPGFEVTPAEGALLDGAWTRLLRRLHAEPGGPAAAAADELIALGDSEEGLRQMVLGFLRLRSEWHAYVDHEEDPTAFALARLRARLGIAGDENDPARAVDEPAFVARLRMLGNWLERTGGAGHVKPATFLPALEQSGRRRLATLLDALFKDSGEPYELQVRGAARLSAAEERHFRSTHGEIVGELATLRERVRRYTTFRRTRAGLLLGVAALREHEHECRARATLGFADLEHHAWRLLTQDEAAAFVQYRLDSRVDHLLVDEFQDTSPLQWQLLRPLLEEMAAGDEARARSAFLVGDVKQSIYGFRGAQPELMAVATDFVTGRMDGARAALDDSRRSAPAIVEWVNALFAGAALAARVPGFPPHGTHRAGAWGRVELAPLVAADEAPAADRPGAALRNPLDEPRADPENTRALREGRLVAARIRELVDAAPLIDADGRARALGYGDVMILLRARTHAAPLERALTEGGIPFVGSARATLLETVEAQDLVALLRFLDAPGRDLDLAHALRSPLFAASDDDLARLALAVRGGAASWWAALALEAARPGASAALQRAAALLPSWLALARRLPAHDLLDRICSDADAAARYASALPPAQAARARGNLHALIQLALEAHAGRYPSLARFVEFLEAARAEAAPDEAPPPASGGQVRVLTIHAAKGLEAAAVFVAQCGSVNNPPQAGWLVEWPARAARPALVALVADKANRDSVSVALVQARQAAAQREEAHLLYVAATRARHFLHFSGFVPGRRSSEPCVHELAAGAFAALGVAPDADGRCVFARGEPARAPAEPPAPPAPACDPRWRAPLAVPDAPMTRPTALTEIDPAAARRGTAIHWLLQQLAAGAPEARLRQRLRAVLGSDVGARELQEWQEEARRVLEAPALARFFDPAVVRRAWNEVPLRSGRMSGVVDRLVDDGSTLWVIDYKTAPGADAAALAARHAPQLAAYREAAQALWAGRVVRSGVIVTATGEWVEC